MNGLRNIKRQLEAEGFPYITASLLSLGVCIGLTGSPCPGESKGPFDYLKRSAKRIYKLLSRDGETIHALPPQKEAKPVIMFDQNEILTRRSFSFFDLDFLYAKRPFSDVFLFHTAHLYELVNVCDLMSSTDRGILQEIDPYGCISYKMFCSSKKMLTREHLGGRPVERLVVLTTKENEYHEDFRDNVLNIGRWSGAPEHRLLDLVNFFYNLHFAGIKDFRSTIKSYSGMDFFAAFDSVQRRLFRSRNMFLWNTDLKYAAKVSEINEMRIGEYKRAKAVMDKDLKTGEGYASDVLSFVLRTVLSL
jgi:mitochondrial import inner membrane translocase subunit TIM50